MGACPFRAATRRGRVCSLGLDGREEMGADAGFCGRVQTRRRGQRGARDGESESEGELGDEDSVGDGEEAERERGIYMTGRRGVQPA